MKFLQTNELIIKRMTTKFNHANATKRKKKKESNKILQSNRKYERQCLNDFNLFKDRIINLNLNHFNINAYYYFNNSFFIFYFPFHSFFLVYCERSFLSSLLN